MTPYELILHVRSFNERKKVDDEEKIILTYLGAYWQRVKRMPSLTSVLHRSSGEVPKRMTSEEILETVKQLNLSMGGTVY